jgi:hypothetical protein
MIADALAMLFKQLAPFSFRRGTLIPQLRIAQHFPDWHPGRFQATKKFDPDKD